MRTEAWTILLASCLSEPLSCRMLDRSLNCCFFKLAAISSSCPMVFLFLFRALAMDNTSLPSTAACCLAGLLGFAACLAAALAAAILLSNAFSSASYFCNLLWLLAFAPFVCVCAFFTCLWVASIGLLACFLTASLALFAFLAFHQSHSSSSPWVMDGAAGAGSCAIISNSLDLTAATASAWIACCLAMVASLISCAAALAARSAFWSCLFLAILIILAILSSFISLDC
mmetsp:Transcript_48759/g.76119  ORF Transcript_48759/g.76119 Transcript_48759/m.76119 type:complete len:229 (-) Transcript_48759:487-1173(-)